MKLIEITPNSIISVLEDMSDGVLRLGADVPESLGETVDEYYMVRSLRLALQKEVEALEAREKELKNSGLIDRISKSKEGGAVGKLYKAVLTTKDIPRVVEGGWPGFYSWVRKNDRFDMLQKRLAEVAVKDYIAAEGQPPNKVEVIKIPDVSITKR